MSAFSIGQKVAAKFTLGESASGDHPSLVCADAGDILYIRSISPSHYTYPYYVSHEDVLHNSFGVTEDEIEPYQEQLNLWDGLPI